MGEMSIGACPGLQVVDLQGFRAARATAESAAHDIRSGRKRRRKKDNQKEKTKGPILVFFMSQIAL